MSDFPKPRLDRLLSGWQRPVAFPMQIWYGPRRRPVQLWTFPFQVDKHGRVLLYLAAGPAGVPVMEPLITNVFHRPLPKHSRIKVITEVAPDGQVVFGTLNHTVN